jgi:peptidoglycan/LPS O-acetylase OafA/YrhL
MTTIQPHLSHPKYRPDIDGLRALAVLAVVVFHAFPDWLPGGFVGVDVFFVISGYLISTIIFENLDRGTFSFSEFYGRRIRRIFPALLLVLATSYIFGWFGLLADEYKQLGKHIAAGAGFISNLVLWSEAGYFDNSAETKPLLHLWSLGIEEQFYIAWPLFIWLAWKRKFNLLTITSLLAIVLFYLNVVGVKKDAVAAFYSPQTRFWELLSGSLLAWTTLYTKGGFARIRERLDTYLASALYREKKETDGKTYFNVLSFLGIILLAYGFFRINRELSFPGKWAIVPVTGAVLLISAGSKAWVNRIILSNKVSIWLGLISFPLYLWHWPLLSFARIIESEVPGIYFRTLAVMLAIVLAWITYKTVERPLRLGKHREIKAVALSILMVIIGCVGYYTYANDGLYFRYRQLQDNIKQFSWPEQKKHSNECIEKFGSSFSTYCLIGNIEKDPDIVLLGDSNANHLFEGLSTVLGDKNLLMIGQGGCLPFVGLTVRLREGELNCQDSMNAALALIKSTKSVKTVIISMMGAAYVNNRRTINGGMMEIHPVGSDDSGNRLSLFEAGMRNTLKLLIGANKDIIFVISTPRLTFDPATCIKYRPLSLSESSIKSPCTMSKDEYRKDSDAYRDIVSNVLKDFPVVKGFDTSTTLCDNNYCYAMINGELLYRDESHLSSQGSLYLAKELLRMGLIPKSL